MISARDGARPRIDARAKVAESARIVGNVTIGSRCYIDHNVLIASSGPLVELLDEVVVLAGSVVRSVGGGARPPSEVHIGPHTLIATLCSIVGSMIESNCSIATGVIMLQDAVIGAGTRIGAGAIVHSRTRLPPNARVGLRHVAVPNGDGFISTADVEEARRAIAALDFFEHSFEVDEQDQLLQQQRVIAKVLAEAHGWEEG